MPGSRLLLAGGLTVASYFVLTCYDFLALRSLHIPLAWSRTLLAAFVGYVFSQNLGLSVLGGSAVRWRMYGSMGLSAKDVVKVVAFCAATFWLGLLALAGVVLCFEPEALAERLELPLATARALGGGMLAVAAAYVVLCAIRRRPVHWLRWSFELPRPRYAIAQVLVSVADWTVAASVLHAVLSASLPIEFPRLLAVFLVAQLLGVASHVPGGIGVFDTTILWLLHDRQPAAATVAALVAYRLVYYIAPLAAGALLYVLHELGRKRESVARAFVTVGTAVDRFAPGVVPRLLALATFGAGAWLLVSGSTPALAGRADAVRRVLPLGLLESSHFAGSVAGVGLLLLARGLQQRLRFAWGASLVLLVAGAAASLLKGLDFEVAGFLLLVAAALAPCRLHFTRHSSLLHAPFTTEWIVGVAVTLLAAGFLVHFSFRHVEVHADLWWRFALDGDAPRALRATVGAAVLALGFAGWRLLRPAQPPPHPPTADEHARAARIAHACGDSQAKLALLGDKSLFWSASGRSFLMYAIEGRCWIALGDPIGDPEEATELAWSFHETADRSGGRTVFYEVLGERLPTYLDLGLTTFKLGEEARVALPGFTLAGNHRRKLRQNAAKAEAAGARFELVPRTAVDALLPELRPISDAWLGAHGGREKGFSVGFFDPAYLRWFPLALIRVGARIVAFANVWIDDGPGPAGTREEFSIDLMRHVADAPPGTMDLLFVRLLELGRDRGYRWFNFGMAPLSGLVDRPLAPLWHKAAGALFRHGENVYHFQGLRQYKEKFDPVWRPRYLASPGGMSLPAVLGDVARRIARGPGAPA